jgi:hypothetical protein
MGYTAWMKRLNDVAVKEGIASDRLSGISWISDCRHIMLGKLLPKDRPHAKWVQKNVK